MARTDEAQRRAERVLRGDGSKADLAMLFLWLRRRTYGNHAVDDIGDFVAHADERNGGVAWRGAKHFADMAVSFVSNVRPTPSMSPLEAITLRAWGALNAMPPDEILRDTGLGQDAVKKIIKRGLKRLYYFNGELVLAPGLTPREQQIFEHFTTILVSRPAFTDEELERQFINALVKNRLVAKHPSKPTPNLRENLALFALEAMHLTRLLLPRYGEALLKAGHLGGMSEDDPPFLSVSVSVPLHRIDNPSFVVSPIFTTGLDARLWCEPPLISTPFWDFPLEINSSGRLQMFK